MTQSINILELIMSSCSSLCLHLLQNLPAASLWLFYIRQYVWSLSHFFMCVNVSEVMVWCSLMGLKDHWCVIIRAGLKCNFTPSFTHCIILKNAKKVSKRWGDEWGRSCSVSLDQDMYENKCGFTDSLGESGGGGPSGQRVLTFFF